MLTIFRMGIPRNLGQLRNGVHITQVATLTSKTTRGEPVKLKKPFPYWKRPITQLEAMMDLTVQRIEEENAKIIVVEGPVAAGKTPLAKLLADEFDMLYLSPPSMDDLLITETGFDLRSLDDQLPESVRSYDNRNFCMCPNDVRANSFQILMYRLRFAQYVDALTHILNTGQGVVLERSCFSDYAFSEAMFAEGYMSKAARDYYIKLRDIGGPLLLRPHVIIYLDVPVQKVQERIKQRNLSYEVNSPVFSSTYLQKMEDVWKHDYFKRESEHSEILIYDWSDGGDVDIIMEHLESLDLDPLNRENSQRGKFDDWKLWRRRWRQKRLEYTNEKNHLVSLIQTPVFDVPEIMAPTEDYMERTRIYSEAPGNEFLSGYNQIAGASLFKILTGAVPGRHRPPPSLVPN